MKLHKIELTGYCAKSPEWPALYLGTAGSYGNEQLAVTLGKGWDGLTVTATFQPAGVTVLVPGDGTLDVPWEATETALDAAKGRIVFDGVTDGRVLISTDIPYAVGNHSDTEGSNSQPPTPSQWEQFVDEVKGDAGRAEQAAKDAEATLQDVKDAAAAAEQSAKDAAAELPKVQQAVQTALDDIATERENSLTALEDEGGKQQSSVAGAGASALEAIQQAGQTVTGQITQTGATQVGAVQSAGTTQVGLVNAAGQQQAENVAQAGAQQVQAVQTAGTSAVGDINDARDDAVEEIETANAHAPQINPDTGYWQTWDAETGEYVDTTTKAQGPQGNKGDTGNPGPQGETGATPQMTIGTVTTLDPGEDATVTITGTAETPVLNFGIPKGEQGDGSTSGSDLPATTAADRGKALTVNAAGTGYELTGPYAPLSAAIIETAKGNPAVCEDSVEWPLQGMRVYGKSTQVSTTALPFEPYTGGKPSPSPEYPQEIVSAGDDGEIEVLVTGKNLLDISKMQQRTTNGITFSLENGGIKISGTATDRTDSPIFTFPLPAGTYISNINSTLFPWLQSVSYVVTRKDGTNWWLNADYAFTVLDSDVGKYFYFAVRAGESVNEIIYPQIEVGSATTSYEPYKSQSLTISTPNGLPGIPVDSGGNFVDADGQQWICNYRDFGAGKDIKYIEYIANYNGESVGDIWMSTTGQLTVGASVLYALDTPIKTPIPADELAAYRALHAYDGTTVVTLDDALAQVEVDYIVKPKAYIEKKLTAIEQKIQEVAAAQIDTQTGG